MNPSKVCGVLTLLFALTGADKSLAQDPTVRGFVTISHTDDGEWRFEYDLSRDTRSIMLGPKADAYHEAAWKLPDDFHVAPEGIYSFLERTDGGDFRKVSIDVSTYRPIVPYAPQPFATLDGGTAVNTGPLGYAAKVGPSRMWVPFTPKFTFSGLGDETVVVPGQENDSLTDVNIPPNGLFVYFGEAEGIGSTEHILSILDHDFPEALRADFVTTSEEFATLYDRELRDALPGQLVIMVSYDNDLLLPEGLGERPPDSTLGFGGGAQNDQIVAKAFGPDEAGTTPEDLTKSRLFFAHEMAHIWQTDLGDDSTRWFAEGGADLLAIRSLERLGYLTKEEAAQKLTACIPKCSESLLHTTLVDSHLNGQPKANYTGGALVLAAAEAATGADGHRDDMFALDRAVHEIDSNIRGQRPLEAFKTALQTLGGTEDAGNAIGLFITERHDDPVAALQTLFDACGLAYRFDQDSFVIEPVPAEDS